VSLERLRYGHTRHRPPGMRNLSVLPGRRNIWLLFIVALGRIVFLLDDLELVTSGLIVIFEGQSLSVHDRRLVLATLRNTLPIILIPGSFSFTSTTGKGNARHGLDNIYNQLQGALYPQD
jgi:hypothetical protein